MNPKVDPTIMKFHIATNMDEVPRNFNMGSSMGFTEVVNCVTEFLIPNSFRCCLSRLEETVSLA